MQSNIPTNGENVKEKTNEKYVVRKYERKNDGTYATDNYNYKYRLVLTGRTRNAEKDTTFVYLSNIKNLTFDKAWKARGLSSDMSDYFNEADAVLVEMW